MVSIVVPVHNAEQFIRQTIESVLQQTYTDSLAQLKQIFTEAVDVCTSALDKMTEIDAAGKEWNSSVMRKQNAEPVTPLEYRLTLSQFKQAAIGQLEKYKYLR